MNLGRRGLLKALGVSAAAAPMVGAQLTGAAGAGISVIGVGRSGGGEIPCSNAATGVKFFDFTAWFLGGGEKETRRNSRYVTALDPDIAMMNLPLNTKVLWQRERNYKIAIEEKRNWFERRFSQQGYVEDWF